MPPCTGGECTSEALHGGGWTVRTHACVASQPPAVAACRGATRNLKPLTVEVDGAGGCNEFGGCHNLVGHQAPLAHLLRELGPCNEHCGREWESAHNRCWAQGGSGHMGAQVCHSHGCFCNTAAAQPPVTLQQQETAIALQQQTLQQQHYSSKTVPFSCMGEDSLVKKMPMMKAPLMPHTSSSAAAATAAAVESTAGKVRGGTRTTFQGPDRNTRRSMQLQCTYAWQHRKHLCAATVQITPIPAHLLICQDQPSHAQHTAGC